MHRVQEQLLALAETENLALSSYYGLAKRLNVANHGSVKFHIDQLFSKGLLDRDPKTGAIVKAAPEKRKIGGLISVPVMGEANCGIATSIADDRVKGFIRLSPSLIPHGVRLNRLYALRAVGDSMNNAKIGERKKPINDGDYVLVEKASTVAPGEYVVSIFDEVANIKKFLVDFHHSRVLLLSESEDPRPPIIVSFEDRHSYLIAGRVVGVVPAIPEVQY